MFSSLVFFLARKGHVVADCTRRRITSPERQQALEHEAVHADQVSMGDGYVRQRTEAKRARRGEDSLGG